MTVDDLKELIREVVNEQLQNQQSKPKDSRSVKEILKSIEQHRWTPPPGSPSTTELIREDRDR
jgi:hypothetical protein